MKGCIRRRNLLKKQTLYQKLDKTSISFFPILMGMIPGEDSVKWPVRDTVGPRPHRGTFFRFSTVPNPGLKIRWRGAVSKEFCFGLFFFGPHFGLK